MTPRVPSHEEHSVVNVGNNQHARGANSASSSSSSLTQLGAATKKPIVAPVDDVSKMLTPATSRHRFTTFHYELNLYCAMVLGSLYYFVARHHDAVRLGMHLLFALIAFDAAKYYYWKGSMAGVPYTLPFVSLLAMIVSPGRFWHDMAAIGMSSRDGMCFNTLVGHYLVFVTDPEGCREILTVDHNYGIYAHPNALWLFGPKNLIYLDTQRHKTFRAILTPALFSQAALVQYARAQEQVVRRYLQQYAKQCQEHPHHVIDGLVAFRSMAAASSQEAFLGPYLTDDMRQHLEKDILTFTMGFLCLPFPYFNSGLHKAIQAKDRIEATIRSLVPQAREYIMAGHEPRCMMEHWSLAILQAAKEQGVDPQQVDCCQDDDMARTVLDFLFAAQDATNSALTYSLDVLDAHRDVLQKMRDEVKATCGADGVVWTKMAMADALPYTGKVANQLLHHKPPVPMIPLVTKNACTLAGHALGKKTIVIPSITYSARVSGNSLEFSPEREDHDHLFVKTFTFGAGQHKCPGRRYAESLLKVFLTVLALEYDFARVSDRPAADDFIYFPTIFPADARFVIQEYKAAEQETNGETTAN